MCLGPHNLQSPLCLLIHFILWQSVNLPAQTLLVPLCVPAPLLLPAALSKPGTSDHRHRRKPVRHTSRKARRLAILLQGNVEIHTLQWVSFSSEIIQIIKNLRWDSWKLLRSCYFFMETFDSIKNGSYGLIPKNLFSLLSSSHLGSIHYSCKLASDNHNYNP